MKLLTFDAVRVEFVLGVDDPTVEAVLPSIEQVSHHLVEGRRVLVWTGLQQVAVHDPTVVLPLFARPAKGGDDGQRCG